MVASESSVSNLKHGIDSSQILWLKRQYCMPVSLSAICYGRYNNNYASTTDSFLSAYLDYFQPKE